MIKIEELRVGNWVYIEGSRQQIDAIENATAPEKCEVDYTLIKHVHPIPLTEELLTEKCGFRRNHYGGLYLYGKFDFDLTKEGYFLVDDVGVYCKHLHQLQNLYFALTGKELPVNL